MKIKLKINFLSDASNATKVHFIRKQFSRECNQKIMKLFHVEKIKTLDNARNIIHEIIETCHGGLRNNPVM